MPKNIFARKSMTIAASLAMVGGAVCTHIGCAEERPSPISPETQKLVSDQAGQMRAMAADPQKADTLKADLTRLIVMERMARSMAGDPAVQRDLQQTVEDPAFKKAYEEAKTMADDPEATRRLQQEILTDRMDTTLVMRVSMMMAKMRQRMGGGKSNDKATDETRK